MELDLPIGTAGLSLGDIGLRLYGGAVRLTLPGSVALTAADTGVDYVLSGLPSVAGVEYTVTYEFPEGVGFSRTWAGGGFPRVTPGAVIIPLRLAAQTIPVNALRNGTTSGVTLTVIELGSGMEPGDYAVTGWPAALPGERWVLVWEIDGIRYYRDWRAGAAPEADLPPETVIRRLLGRYWLEAWMGPALDERLYCPARALGFAGEEASFSVDSADDVSPWTPSEVKTSVGYALLRLRELDRFDDGVTAGATTIDSEDRIVSHEYRLYALDFELAVPSKPKGGADPIAIVEQRRAAIEAIFEGLSLLPEDQQVLSMRQLGRYPTRRRGGSDDGTWRRAFLTVQIRARVRRIHAGPQEVALP